MLISKPLPVKYATQNKPNRSYIFKNTFWSFRYWAYHVRISYQLKFLIAKSSSVHSKYANLILRSNEDLAHIQTHSELERELSTDTTLTKTQNCSEFDAIAN